MSSELHCPKCKQELSVLEITTPFNCPGCGVALSVRGSGALTIIDIALQLLLGTVVIACFVSAHIVGYIIGVLLVIGWLWLMFAAARKVLTVHLQEAKTGGKSGETAI